MSKVQEFLSFIANEKRYSIHTQDAYALDLRQCAQFLRSAFEQDELADVSAVQLRTWMAEMVDEGISSRTVNRKLTSIRSFFKFLRKDNPQLADPTSRLKSLKTEKRLPQFVPQQHLIDLFEGEYFSSDFEGVRDKVMLLLFWETGMRRAELLNLKITDVNFSKQNVRVFGKRSKEREIPLTTSLIQEIHTYCDLRQNHFEVTEEEYLLVNNVGKVMSEGFVNRTVNFYLSKVTTTSKKSPHVLRHSFATHMLNNGASLDGIKELLGHASLAATQVYTHTSIAELKNIHQRSHPKGA